MCENDAFLQFLMPISNPLLFALDHASNLKQLGQVQM
jgi:hypothetical protein